MAGRVVARDGREHMKWPFFELMVLDLPRPLVHMRKQEPSENARLGLRVVDEIPTVVSSHLAANEKQHALTIYEALARFTRRELLPCRAIDTVEACDH